MNIWGCIGIVVILIIVFVCAEDVYWRYKYRKPPELPEDYES